MDGRLRVRGANKAALAGTHWLLRSAVATEPACNWRIECRSRANARGRVGCGRAVRAWCCEGNKP